MCVGYIDRMRRLERSERMLNFNIVKGWADPKKFTMSPQQWWPIAGEIVPKIKIPSKRSLQKLHNLFKNIGNGQR